MNSATIVPITNCIDICNPGLRFKKYSTFSKTFLSFLIAEYMYNNPNITPFIKRTMANPNGMAIIYLSGVITSYYLLFCVQVQPTL